MWITLRNIWFLCIKELKSVLSDYVLMGLIIVMFSVASYSVAKGMAVEVKNGSVAVVNEDQSPLSWRIIDALRPPYFKKPELINLDEIDESMNNGKYIFILVIPKDYEKNLLQQRAPELQLLIDATAVSQAGLGASFIQQVVVAETAAYFSKDHPLSGLPMSLVTKVLFNPNADYTWFAGPMQIVANAGLLAMLLVGAAIIREKERGTIEHLLVMPVNALEIALSKVIGNAIVITAASIGSLYLVVSLWLGVPLVGSVPIFLLSLVIFLFAVGSLGILLGTFAPTMPQFGLLVIPVYVIMRLLSGGESPREGMPDWVQIITLFSPQTQFAMTTQNLLLRQAGLETVWPNLIYMSLMAIVFFAFALSRFKKMLANQG
ncbi:Inner membrane transport permease YhhJ [Oligella urethralis]|uniref:Inner membrane transport permease yhhJ n=1 Tax=Oligella urethralis TaxID=90245 RepID=A0A2X1UT93_9BURK|nr:ABC transporter permease [Oligella urethralis]WOS36602.1 Inner membrane transport permease YhhJ [Oligella urethralis]SPY07651.1 Inner membrane transport permease yhhJ [Oligella urethralis]SUA52790.1 Inner membrane transport permease yhhJ [Oligella urethralis]SUA63422.1 Inner membrane transport permease yhhJ [Oligella urethralis]